MSKLKPIKDKILVKPLKGEEVRNGIFIPDSAQENSNMAEVISVGYEVKQEGYVKPGDRVMLMKMTGHQFQSDGEDYILITIDGILGVEKD